MLDSQMQQASVYSRNKELISRILFVVGALIVYRIGTFVPVSGIDPVILKDIFNSQSGGVFGVFDLFSGGALSRMSVFSLNIFPYISAAIIMQLMGAISPTVAEIKKQGASGQRKITQWTRYLTVLLASTQAYGISIGLEAMTTSQGTSAVIESGLAFRLTTVVSLLGGTMFLMWLGEQITNRGIGNGISLIIYAGIVSSIPSSISSLFELGRTGSVSTEFILGIIVLALAVIVLIVMVERAQRRVMIQYPKRQVGMKVTGGQTTHMPLKINTSGVIPAIFASSILLVPVTIAGFSGAGSPEWLQSISAVLGRGQPGFMIAYGTLIAFFAYFYTTVVFNSEETAENLRKNGAIVPGYRPGEMTSKYFDHVLTLLTTIGVIYLLFVCLLPEFLIAEFALPFYFGGTSLLIVVTVTIDTVSQIQNHMLSHQYQNMLNRQQKRGRKFR